jgi:hydroxymethylbilane synthase
MPEQQIIRIGTRRSQLALWQTNYVRACLLEKFPPAGVELVHLTTTGDRIIDKPLPEIGGKGVFTQELEDALLAGQIDMAVHSLKDLPTELSPEFTIGAILPRANPFDALISRNRHTLNTLPSSVVVGTSSLRRRAQLLAYRPDLRTESLRGNVDTRIRKALDADGPYDAIILAVAGLERLDRDDVISDIIDNEIMLPAPGQGAIAVQCRADDETTLTFLAKLDDAQTRTAVTAERAFLNQLDAGCRLPVSAYATLNGGTIHLVGRVNSLDGTQTITVRGDAPLNETSLLGTRLANEARADGAEALLAAIRKELPT